MYCSAQIVNVNKSNLNRRGLLVGTPLWFSFSFFVSLWIHRQSLEVETMHRPLFVLSVDNT